MENRIVIDEKQLFNHFMSLLSTPGPTQACVKISKDDLRIKGNFPMENSILSLIKELNKKKNVKLQIIRHNSNLVIVSGLEAHNEIREINDLSEDIHKKIKKIPITFGAHLDEISYIITKKKETDFFKEDGWYLIPLCAPPQLFRGQYYYKDNTTRIREILNPKIKIVGFRDKKFVTNIGSGICYKVEELAEDKSTTLDAEGEIKKILISRKWRQKNHFLAKITATNMKIKEGDIVIADYGDWKKSPHYENTEDVIFSKALDDRVGCIAILYALMELSKENILSKAILTSAEEGVPKDISWGRIIRPTYQKFCNNDVITLICDGVDGIRLEEFKDNNAPLEEAIIIPYTSFGKGGGDVGLFSRFRDQIIPKLEKIYNEKIAVTSTDYSSRSFEIKIMDDWTTIGFIQWSCGEPDDDLSICHNKETVSFKQIINIIRTMYHSFKILSK